MIKAIIFDFNGVIVETTATNSKIYEKIFMRFGQNVAQKVKEHYEKYGGIPRQLRIKIYLEDFAKVRATDELIKEISEEFTKQYLESLRSASLVKGVRRFMENEGKKYLKFLSSGAPQNDIEQMLEILNLEQYFVKGYGAPQSKAEHIADIIHRYNFKPFQVVFVGDSPKDKEAAEKNGIHFIARERGLDSLKNEKFKIMDFYDLHKVIEMIEKRQQVGSI